jgi:membrane-associated protease RseP (regulator of RpoE activity)
LAPIAEPTANAARQSTGQGPNLFQQERSVGGLREQEEAEQRTANRLNRDARQEARQQAIQAAQTINTSDLRAADLGLWFSSQAGANGLTVGDVANQSALARAGFREGDRIVSINGQPVTTEAQFVQMLMTPAAGNQPLSVVVARDGQQQPLSVLPALVSQGIATFDPLYQAGLLLDERNPDRLVVTRVFPRTPAFYAGLRPGDVITKLNGAPITSLLSLNQALQGGAGSVLGLQIDRNGQVRQLNLGESDNSIRTAMRPNYGANGSTSGSLQSGNDTAPATAAPRAIKPPGVLLNPRPLPDARSSPAGGTPVPPSLQIQPALPSTGAPTAAPGASPSVIPPTGTVGTGTASSQGTVNPSVVGGASPPRPTPAANIGPAAPSSQGTVNPAIGGGTHSSPSGGTAGPGSGGL